MRNIVVLPGDGIGKEVTTEAVKVLDKVSKIFNHPFQFHEYEVGGASIDKYGKAITSVVLKACKEADAVLLGAVGSEKWNSLPLAKRPEYALLILRKELGCFANLRPIRLTPSLYDKTPIQRQIVSKGIDFIVVRELLNGLYYGKRGIRESIDGDKEAFDTAVYPESAIRRISRLAFDLAGKRRNQVTSLDKSNILATSRLWRDTVTEVSKEFPDCSLEHQIIDCASMKILMSPADYDVILVNNEYGDIISEEASVLGASVGMIPSASIGERPPFLFEPIHGTAPDIAGQGIANPIGAILTAALLLRFSFDYEKEATVIEKAVEHVLKQGYRTHDLTSSGEPFLSTTELGNKVVEAIDKAA